MVKNGRRGKFMGSECKREQNIRKQRGKVWKDRGKGKNIIKKARKGRI